MAKSLTKEENILLTLINAFQNYEKEKLNHLVNISKSLIEVREKVKEEMEKLPPQFNVFNSINLLNHENYNSNLFANFLDIKFKYNDNEISFAKLFLKYLTKEFGWEFDLENIKIEDIEIKRELPTEERKRIDIFIGYKEKFAVIIENKIWADDGYKQLENYYNYVKNQEYDKIYIIYLTPYEREPSEESLSKELYKEKGSKLYGKFANIKHAEIGYWLEGILKRQEFSFLNNEEENNKYNYKLLKSALIQIIDNEKSISGENEEKNMEEKEIKRVLNENLFKYIETVEKADEYIGMFNKVSELIKEQKKLIIKKDVLPYFKFANEVVEELEKQGYKKSEDYNIYNENQKDIANSIVDKNLAEHIDLLGLIWLQSEAKNYSAIDNYRFGVWATDDKLKRKIKKLKSKIEKDIFNKFIEKKNGWVLYYDINIKEDKSSKIAKAMIDLYELLKKEIK